MVLKSVEGGDLKITKKDGKVMVNNAAIIQPDGITDRGMMHEIDKVLIPDNFTMKDLKN